VRMIRSPYTLPALLGLPALLVCVVPTEAQTPTFTVRGQVVEEVHSTWIGGATVRLSGHPSFITDSDGRFRFTDVAPGLHTLIVEAMGYRPRQIPLTIRADTVLHVEMEVDPVRLDSLLVEAGTITLRGRVTDRATGRRIPEARVRAPDVYTLTIGLEPDSIGIRLFAGAVSQLEIRSRAVPLSQTFLISAMACSSEERPVGRHLRNP